MKVNFFSPLMKPMEKDSLFLCMIIFISITSGVTVYLSKSIPAMLMSTFVSTIISIFIYCLIKNSRK